MRKYLTQIAAALPLVVVACSGEAPHRLGATYGNSALSSVSVASPVAGNGTAGSPILVPVATGSTAGLEASSDFIKLSAVPATGIIPVILRTPAGSDLTATGVRSFSNPTQPAGMKFYTMGRVAIEIATLTGTAGGGPLSCQFEQNGSVIGSRNSSPVTFASGTLNNTAADGTGSYYTNASIFPGGTGVDLSTNGLNINCTTVFTGLSAFTGRFVVLGYYQ